MAEPTITFDVTQEDWDRAIDARQNSGKDMRKDSERVDELRDEYDFSQGVRGKYAARYSEGTNLVVENPESVEPALMV